VLSTIVKPEGELVPGLTLIELAYGLAPSGLELPCCVTASVRVPPLVVCAVIVFESSVVAASGGLPTALAVTSHVPIVEPAIATDPLPVAPVMVVGAQAAPKQSPIDMVVVADAPAAQSSELEASTAAVRTFLFIFILLSKLCSDELQDSDRLNSEQFSGQDPKRLK
jgi:hypothetical protein